MSKPDKISMPLDQLYRIVLNNDKSEFVNMVGRWFDIPTTEEKPKFKVTIEKI